MNIEHIPGKANIVVDGLCRYCEFTIEFQENLISSRNAFIMETTENYNEDICKQNYLQIEKFSTSPGRKIF
jgi:hypothetical protein